MKTPCFGTHLRERLFDSLCAYPGGLFMANWKKDPWPDSKPDHFFTYQSGQNSGFEGLQPPCRNCLNVITTTHLTVDKH